MRELKEEIMRELKRELKQEIRSEGAHARELKQGSSSERALARELEKRRQAGKQAVGRHSVGAMSWRGLFACNHTLTEGQDIRFHNFSAQCVYFNQSWVSPRDPVFIAPIAWLNQAIGRLNVYTLMVDV